MIVLDENVPESQLHRLRGWRIRARQMGGAAGRAGMSDAEIIPLLRSLAHPTFFTRDRDFLQPWLCDPACCLVDLDVGQYEVASFVRRGLRHREFKTRANRWGAVIRAGHDRLTVWRRGHDVQRLAW